MADKHGMISGTDVTFVVPRHTYSFDRLMHLVLERWPDGFYQGADEEHASPITDLQCHQQSDTISTEFFIYKHQQACEEWNREGWTEETANDMIHFLIEDNPTDRDTVRITSVVGSFTPELITLMARVIEAFQKRAA
jgi:hypothetical protein